MSDTEIRPENPGQNPSDTRARPGLLVVGSGPAGVAAARAYVEAGGPGPVTIVGADVDHPYLRPPLSKDVLAGRSPAEGTPIGELPEAVTLRLGERVSGLDLAARTARIGEETLAFERVVVTVGAVPRPLPVAEPGAEVFTLRSLSDARRLVEAAGHARTAVVVGSGFIGCEAAASLALRGVATTLVTPEDAPQAARLGAFAGERIAEWLTALGVTVRTGVRVTGVDAPRTLHLDDGTTLAPDLVLAAVGIAPAAGDLADEAGLPVHEGRLVADEFLAVAPGVWTAGDCARALNAAAGRPIPVEHWGDAEAMGALAGRNAAADATGATAAAAQPWSDVPGFWSEIGEHAIKYWAWGDSHECAEVVQRPGAFTVWYADADDRVVGVLTYRADDDYERGRALVREGATLTQALAGDRIEEEGEEG